MDPYKKQYEKRVGCALLEMFKIAKLLEQYNVIIYIPGYSVYIDKIDIDLKNNTKQRFLVLSNKYDVEFLNSEHLWWDPSHYKKFKV